MTPGNGKRSLDGLMSYVVDRIALTGEYGEWNFGSRVFDSISNAHDCMVVERLVHARRVVATFVDALAY